MEMEQVEKVRKGLRTCIEAISSASCPDECPYADRCWAENGADETEELLYVALMRDAQALIEEDYTTRLLPYGELVESKGMGWAEVWFLPDEEVEESKELFEIAFIGSYYATGDGDHGCVSADTYNKPYHTRIWSGVNPPTDERGRQNRGTDTCVCRRHVADLDAGGKGLAGPGSGARVDQLPGREEPQTRRPGPRTAPRLCPRRGHHKL